MSELWKIAVFIICSISIVFFLIAGAMLLQQGDGGGESASDNFIENEEETEGEGVEYLEEDTSVSVVPATQAVLVEQNWKDEQYYYGNNRPSSLILTLGEESWTVDFPDEWEEFGVRFTSSVQTDTLKVAINGVYEGTECDDTVIAEIGVWYE